MSTDDLAEKAAERVREILAEAEDRAAEIVREAEEEGRRIRARAEDNARGRVDEARRALDELEARLGAPLHGARDAEADSRVEPPAAESAVEPVTKASPKPPPKPARRRKPEPVASRADDSQAARLVAMKLALDGTPRDDARDQLAGEYDIADLDALLDDVYAKAGR